jgi:glutamine amidotransferase
LKVVIIKYNAGNVASVQFALKRLGVDAIISDDVNEITSADRVIFPGVGEASSALRALTNAGLDRVIVGLKQPVLGVCLGMQLLCSDSEEGNTKGLGVFDTSVRRIDSGVLSCTEKIPHVGWNEIAQLKSRLFSGINENAFVYYVHGFCADVCEQSNAITNYVRPFSAGLEKNNFYGVQFHPEKSGSTGEQIIRNFLEL